VLLHRPSRVLKQGYTMLTDDKDKQILTSSTQLYSEQTIHIVLKDGKAKAQIVDVNTEKNTTETSETPTEPYNNI
ncbi:MAG: exodeoxyribonuclease VII large subunit, partial [Psychrobacter glaciei]